MVKAKKTKYPEPKRVKVGRNKFVCDLDGKTPLMGLSWDSGNGQYFSTFFKNEKDFKAGLKTRKDYSFGVHYEDAVLKFKVFIKDNQEFILSAPTADVEVEQDITRNLTDKDKEWFDKFYQDLGIDEEPPESISFGGIGLEQSDIPDAKFTSKIKIDKKYALHYIKQLLSDEEIKIEVIRMLKLNDLLPKQHNILTIENIMDYYINENKCSLREKRQCKNTMNYFSSVIKKKSINDITEDDIYTYRDFTRDKCDAKKKSTTWLNGRYTRVKTVLNFYNKNKKGNGEKELVKKVLDYCKVLTRVDDIIKEPPKTFDPITVKKLFERAIEQNNRKMLLMLLLMLNTGYTPVDIRGLKKDAVKKKEDLTYILFSRRKTGQVFKRVNCLWGITAKLLGEQIQKYPNSPYVFNSNWGSSYGESTLTRHFREFFDIPKEIKHLDGTKVNAKHFKDTLTTSLAFTVTNVNILKITIGHSLSNNKDEFWKYIDSRPEQQKPASDILYAKFQDAIKIIENNYSPHT